MNDVAECFALAMRLAHEHRLLPRLIMARAAHIVSAEDYSGGAMTAIEAAAEALVAERSDTRIFPAGRRP